VTFRAVVTRENTALLAALAATLVVQFGTLWCGFHDDDYVHLWEMQTNSLHVFLLQSHAGHVMFLPKLIMFVLSGLFGPIPVPHMVLALALHLLNVALLFRVALRLGGGPWPIGIICALWGTSPAQQGVLSWMSAHGFIIGTTTTLAILNELATASHERRALRAAELVRMNVLAVIGATSLGIAGSVALALPIVVWFLAPPDSSRWRAAVAMVPELVVTVVVLSTAQKIPASYDFRSIVILLGYLVSYGTATVLAGAFVTNVRQGMGIEHAASALASPVSVAIAGVALAFVTWDFIRASAGERRVIAGLLALSFAMYGAIAVGRAGYTILLPPSSLAMQDRYHYAPTVGIVIAAALILSRAARAHTSSLRSVGLWLTAHAIVVLASTPVALDHPSRESGVWSQHHRTLTEQAITSVLEAQPRGIVYLSNEDFAPVLVILKMGGSRAGFPGIGAYFALAHDCAWAGRRVRFVDDDPQVEKSLQTWKAQVRDCFATSEQARSEGSRVHSLDETTPPELRSALRSSVDPVLARALAQAWADEHARH
jgi:hypothetical protein